MIFWKTYIGLTLMSLSVSVEDSQINVGRSLIDIPIGSGSSEYAVNDSGLRAHALLERSLTPEEDVHTA